MSEEKNIMKANIGLRIRQLREGRSMSAADLAKAAQLKAEDLDAYEKNKVIPSIGELMNLASALGIHLSTFFQTSTPEKRVELVRAEQRWKIPPQSQSAAMLNYTYQALSYQMTDKIMAPFFIEIPAGQTSQQSSRHEGEEFIFLLSGGLLAMIDGQQYELQPGDALYFDSRLEHTLRSRGPESAILLAVVANSQRRTAGGDEIQRAFEGG